MKTTSIITIVSLCLTFMLTSFSYAASSLLQARAKLEGAKQEAQALAAANPANVELSAVAADKAQALANFDSAQSTKFGSNWQTRWQNSTYENADDEAVDIYIKNGPFIISIPSISALKKKELLTHIAAKPVLVKEDLATVLLFRQHNAELAGRIQEFAELLPSQGIRDSEYFAIKHLGLAGRQGRMHVDSWGPHMSVQDWFDLLSANAPISPATYAAARDHLLAEVARRMIEKHNATSQKVEGPEFNATLSPVLKALDAPKFNGLAAAISALGIDLTIPTLNYSYQESLAANVGSATASRTKFTTAWGAEVGYQEGLGSIMFVKGRDAYAAWRDGLTSDK